MQLMRLGMVNGLQAVGVVDDTLPPDADLSIVHNSDFAEITYAQIREAMGGEAYPMEIVGSEVDWVIQAVNQGIDAHLEACNVPLRGDSYERIGERRLRCKVSPESLPTLLRRLEELDPEIEDDPDGCPICLVDAILGTLGFNEYGEFVGKEEE